jgi:hypothetical protein
LPNWCKGDTISFSKTAWFVRDGVFLCRFMSGGHKSWSLLSHQGGFFLSHNWRLHELVTDGS